MACDLLYIGSLYYCGPVAMSIRDRDVDGVYALSVKIIV